MITTILALDLGTTTGWALRGSDGSVTSGSESFRPQRFEGGGMPLPEAGEVLGFLPHFTVLDDVGVEEGGADHAAGRDVPRHRTRN